MVPCQLTVTALVAGVATLAMGVIGRYPCALAAGLVCGGLFLLCLFISPLAGVIPPQATAPVLVIVGAAMLELVRDLSWDEPGIALPVLLTVVLMPMTYSITNGVGAGFIAYTILALLGGRRVHPLLLLFSAIFVWYFAHGVV